jgi:hypothetical protein
MSADPLLQALSRLPTRDLAPARGEAVRARARKALRCPPPPPGAVLAFTWGVTGAVGAYLAWALMLAAR